MNKILPLVALFAAAVLLPGCGSPGTPSELTVPTLPLTNVACNEFAFYLDPALGNDYQCESLPESSNSDIPMDVFIYPAHTELTIQNYPLTQTQFPPQVWIYPVSRFSELLPDILPSRLSDLEELISGSTWSNGELPFLPPIPQTQEFYVQSAIIKFNGGQGVRFITEYSEAPTPITNRKIIYTFQGLTDDGMYWVALTLPISSSILPADYDTLPEGYTQESLILNYSSYVSEVKEALAEQAPGSFSPTINSLDSLISSITVRQ